MSTVLHSIFDPASPASIFGLLGVAVGAAWPLFARREAMLAGQASSTALFAAHFALIGSTTGAAACLVAIVQTAAAWRVRTRGVLLAVNGGCLAILGIVAAQNWRGWPSFFAVAGAVLATVGRVEVAPHRMCWWFLAGSLTSAGHNTLVGSPFGLASDALTFGATAFGALRRGRRRNCAW